MQPDLLKPKEVARLLNVSTDTLEGWRAKRTGPAWVKLGTSKTSPVRYPRAAVEQFLKGKQ